MIPFPIIITKKQTPIAGKNLLSQSINGETVLYTSGSNLLRGAWFMTGGIIGVGDSSYIQIQVARGYVNGLEPVIGKLATPISGDSKNPAPLIKAKAEFDTEGRAWAGILITVDPSTGSLKHTTQKTLTEKDLTITVLTTPFVPTKDGSSYFHPIAVIRQDPDTKDPLTPIQISYFDYQWGTFKQGAFWRHSMIPN